MLRVPVHADPFRADGGQPAQPDLLVRRGTSDDVRSTLFDDRPAFPSPGCTTVSVYPHESGQPSEFRRLVERRTFN